MTKPLPVLLFYYFSKKAVFCLTLLLESFYQLTDINPSLLLVLYMDLVLSFLLFLHHQ